MNDMKRDWDARARENARWYINTVRRDQSEEEFDATGRMEVERCILTDPSFTERRNLKRLHLLEIGCGIGRMTRHLAGLFGEVYAVDVSGEMIAQARERLNEYTNVHLQETSGSDFSHLPDECIDCAFSAYVFQHVPEREVVMSNIRDALRVLRPGGVFKFQVNGYDGEDFASQPKDTWAGVSFSETEIRQAAKDFGAELVSLIGAGTLGCWVMLRKPLHSTLLSETTPRVIAFGRSDDPALTAIPTMGVYAYLTIVLSDLAPDRLDANRLVLEAGDRTLPAIYSGVVGDNYAAALDNDYDSGSTAQTSFAIPEDFPPGLQRVRVCIDERTASEWAEIEFLPPEPLPPRIHYASNVIDGGVDIYASGEKSRFRVFVYDLARNADRDALRVYIDNEAIEVEEARYIPGAGFHEIIAQLPKGIAAGSHNLIVAAGSLRSTPATFDVQEGKETTEQTEIHETNRRV
ncbi:MAG: methyltransferase domain-containing protein [Acidobacteria bacterium]|nr:methyltransferase domain-containing protein [Acidobacteriota bacterium]MCW5970673.1 methyltransferase domain-containing protein [Blastocatellales bacterium]